MCEFWIIRFAAHGINGPHLTVGKFSTLQVEQRKQCFFPTKTHLADTLQSSFTKTHEVWVKDGRQFHMYEFSAQRIPKFKKVLVFKQGRSSAFRPFRSMHVMLPGAIHDDNDNNYDGQKFLFRVSAIIRTDFPVINSRTFGSSASFEQFTFCVFVTRKKKLHFGVCNTSEKTFPGLCIKILFTNRTTVWWCELLRILKDTHWYWQLILYRNSVVGNTDIFVHISKQSVKQKEKHWTVSLLLSSDA